MRHPTAGRPKLPSRVQITTKIDQKTKSRLRAEAKRQLPPGKKRIEIGRVIDYLVRRYLP